MLLMPASLHAGAATPSDGAKAARSQASRQPKPPAPAPAQDAAGQDRTDGRETQPSGQHPGSAAPAESSSEHTGQAKGTDQTFWAEGTGPAPQQRAAAVQACLQPPPDLGAELPRGAAAAPHPPEGGSNANSGSNLGTGDPQGPRQGQEGSSTADGVEAPCSNSDRARVEQPMCVRDLLAAERGRIEAAAYAMPEIPGAMPALFAAHVQAVESDDDCILIP